MMLVCGMQLLFGAKKDQALKALDHARREIVQHNGEWLQ